MGRETFGQVGLVDSLSASWGSLADHELGAIKKGGVTRILISIPGHNTSFHPRFQHLFNPLQRPPALSFRSFRPFLTPYSPYQLPTGSPPLPPSIYYPVTTNDVAHRGFRIWLGALLRRRR